MSDRIPEDAGSRNTRRQVLLITIPLTLVSALLLSAFVSCTRGHGFGHGRHGFGDPESAREHIERHTDWVLDRLDATDTQKDRIVEILDGSVDDLYALRSRHRAHHDEIIELFTAPVIDPAAIESIRVEELALADEASAKLAVALVEVAEVLTPEQRVEIREWADHLHR
ncbi:MAG: Spy/CpxP family protein refolding chaperone [Myxococcota bacterium]